MRRNVVVAAITVLALAVLAFFLIVQPFSDGTDEALESVSVTEGEQPELTVDTPVEVTEPIIRVISEGDGLELAGEDYFRAGYLIAKGADGELIDSSYTSGQTALFELVTMEEATSPQTIPGLPESMIEQLEGTPIGSTVLVATPAEAFFGDVTEQAGFEPDETLLFYFDIVDGTRVSATEAPSGDAQDLPEGIPSPVVDGDDVTGIDGSTAAPVAEAAVTVVIEGDGDEVRADQAVVANYFGAIYPDGETFDESFSRPQPSVFGLDGVIPCWTDLLAGQKVGSRVVLTCPSETAYGDTERGPIQPGDALTFVIDIRDAF